MSIKVLRFKNNKIPVYYFDSLGSTNEELKNYRAKGDLPNYTTILASTQLSGRGQRNNQWYDEAGKSLLTSTFIKFYPEVSPLKVLLAFSLSAYYACLTEVDDIYIKWPNDIISEEGFKIAGILIENTINSSGVSNTIGGVGINVSVMNFPPNIPNARSLEQLNNGKNTISKDKLLEKYLDLLLGYLNFSIEALQNEYCSKLMGYQSYRIFHKIPQNEPVELKIIGVGEDGSLKTVDRAGIEQVFYNKELEWVFV